MGQKSNVTLYVDTEVVQRAKELGLNISKVSENALIEAIRKLEAPNPPSNPSGIEKTKSKAQELQRVLW